jgi:hypothetical protein
MNLGSGRWPILFRGVVPRRTIHWDVLDQLAAFAIGRHLVAASSLREIGGWRRP